MLSWNVHALPFDETVERRIDNIAREVRTRQPDLVLLQEVWIDSDATRLACGLRAHYERVPDADSVRAGLLAPFGHRRGGLLALVRRESGWRVDASVESHFAEYAVSSPWYRLSELDGIAGKGVQRFAIGDGKRAVVVIQTHLQTPYPAREHPYEELRRAQIDELLGLARRARDADAVIVAGDLNVGEEDAALYGALTAELVDLTAAYRRACGSCATHIATNGSETRWIDYVLARRDSALGPRGRVERIRNRARDDPYSDHHGLLVELEVR